MPEWLPYLISAVFGLLVGAVIWLAKVAWPFIQKVSHFFDDVAGEKERPGVPARPGLMERVAAIEHEVKTNHGTSLKDAVKRVEEVQAKQGEQMNEQSDKLRALHDRYTKPKELV